MYTDHLGTDILSQESNTETHREPEKLLEARRCRYETSVWGRLTAKGKGICPVHAPQKSASHEWVTTGESTGKEAKDMPQEVAAIKNWNEAIK